MSRLFPVGILLVVAATWPLAAQQPTPIASGAAFKAATAKARASALTTIQGNALDSTNVKLSNVTVRLRDARFGRIVDTELTDKSGLFAFRAVDPGIYIVEIVGNDESILAASQLLSVNAGDAVSAVVKLPFRVPPFAGVLGGATTSSAAAIATQAVASSIVAVVPTRPVSPNQ
jgi:hypothetical protein